LSKADKYVLGLVTKNPNLLVPHFLIHSYLYYVADAPIIEDATFDVLVKRLGEEWEAVEHPHKHLIDRDLLKTGFYLEYPGIVRGAAEWLLVEFAKGKRK
jgi:hypothetical protein